MPKYRPTVVIGLGGTGKNILISLKRMIAENRPGGLNEFPFLRFLEIDTDVAIPTAKSKIQTLSEKDLTLDPSREVFQLTGDWVGALNLDNFPQIKEWFPSELTPSLIPSEFKLGAGQKKPQGRFAFAYNAPQIYDKIRNALDGIINIDLVMKMGLSTNDFDDKLSIFICGSICGGTGAGTFLDTAYMVRHAAQSLNKTVFIHGMFAMSTIFDGIQGDSRIKPNCYASLVELDHFSNTLTYQNPYQRFVPAYKNFPFDYSESANNKPFDFPFLFDKTNQASVSFDSPADLGEMIARFIYLLTGSEAAAHYESLDSNVRSNIGEKYTNLLNKPNLYRSMGSMSYVYPKRLVQQLLGYTLCKRYFELILDKSYNSTEVQALADGFLNMYKFNPKSSLQDRFKSFKPQGAAECEFTAYAQSAWEDFAEGDGGIKQGDKKQYTQRLREFMDQVELQFSVYRDQNASKAKDVKKEFTSSLDKRIEELLSLARSEDKANGNKLSRGSAKRVANVLEALLRVFEDAKARFKTEESNHASESKVLKSDFATHLDDIQATADGIIPQGGKLKKQLEEAGSCFVAYFTAKELEFVKEQGFQLLDGIRDRLGDEDGILVGMKAKAAAFMNLCKEFEEAAAGVSRVLAESTSYKSGNLVRALFDYRTDIDDAFARVWKDPDHGEEFILTQLSEGLKGRDFFGPTYDQAQAMGQASLTIRLLKLAEAPFAPLVDSINIEDRIIGDAESWANFSRGSFWASANIFVQLNGAELSRVGIDPSKGEFFAITVPGEHYIGSPCARMTGIIAQMAGQKKCPVDTDAERKITCPHHDKCIKRSILENARDNVAIIHTEERGEINIIKTVAGFPLHALSTTSVCQPYYKQSHELVLKNAKAKNLEEDQLHMFGPIQFPDIFERTEDYGKMISEFKAKLLLGYAVKKLVIERLSIRFYTAEDDAFQAPEPSLKLGTNVDEVLRRFQSNRSKDRADIGQFSAELDRYVNAIFDLADEGPRNSIFTRLQGVYKDMKSGTSIPDGFSREDADSLNAFAMARYKKPLVEASAANSVFIR
jgi:hypothetical protein